MKKVCLIGQFPPPIHGLSKALQTIIDSEYMNNQYILNYIDIKNNKLFLKHLRTINKTDADLYYFTISQTKFGNIRDLIILQKVLKKGKKVVIHYHGGYYKELYNSFHSLQKYLNRKLLNQIDIMIVLSESLKSLFTDLIDAKQIRICENFIEESSLIDIVQFESKLKNLKDEEKNLKIIYLSNFIESKGYKDVLRSASMLRDYNVEFHFAGAFFADQDKLQFLDEISRKNLENKVYYYGIVKGEEKKRLLLEGDVFILPTYYPKEGQPISIIEAMGNGMTIITTKHSGIPDIVTNRNGYLINPKSPNEIKDIVVKLAEDRTKLVDFALNNREITMEKFKEIDYLKRIESIFEEALKNEN